jgi:hypothetical protein
MSQEFTALSLATDSKENAEYGSQRVWRTGQQS